MTDRPAMIDSLPRHACDLFRAADLRVTGGVNRGAALAGIDDVCRGDIYGLAPHAHPLRVLLHPHRGREWHAIACGSVNGRQGGVLCVSARYTLMTPDAETVELLLLHHMQQEQAGPGALYVLPLSPMLPRRDYVLIRTEAAPASARRGEPICPSFARGTRIALPSGAQCAIEALAPGDLVLTRDHGPRPVRWIGRTGLQATGAFAPVIIPRGAMGNPGDLIVGPHQRLFLYRQGHSPGLPAGGLLVQARHLIDGTLIHQREGGVVEYLCLALDDHEIVYAEGVATESLLIDAATLQRLPDALATALLARFPGLEQKPHFGTEAHGPDLDRIGRDTLFRPLPARNG